MAATASPAAYVFQPIHRVLAKFPLYTYPAILPPARSASSGLPILWIHPPSSPASTPLSGDVECLKWQAWLALRGVPVKLRTDIRAEGGIDGRLPTLQLPDNTLRAPAVIPTALSVPSRPHEGYLSAALETESHAFIALLESTLHAALFPFETPVPGPLTAVLPPAWLAVKKDVAYKFDEAVDAIRAIGGRLGEDEWFLGSRTPTALDAAAFAYLYIALNVKDGDPAEKLKKEVEEWPNLVGWEQSVEQLVRVALK